MSELSKEARDLIARAGDSHDPSAADEERVWSKVLAAAPAFVLPAEPPPAAAAAAGSSTLKLIAAGTIVLGVGGAWWWSVDSAPAPAIEPPVAAAPIVVEPAPTAPEPEPEPALAAPEVKVEKKPARKRSAPPPSTLEAELEILQRAKIAVKSGELDRALVELDDHRRRFPSGELRQETDGTRARVLCLLGRADDARLAAGKFLAEFPQSALAPLVRDCLKRFP